MKKGLKVIILTGFVSFLMGCDVSKTFYTKTHTNVSVNKKIYRLDLSNSNKEIALDEFENLRMLNLSSIKNIAVLNKIINSIPNTEKLKILILDDNNLTSIPSSVFRLRKLKHLSLNHNDSLNVQSTFRLLSNLSLEFLDFQFNKLISIPKEISSLVTLRELNFSNNELDQTKGICYLSALPVLKSLWLRDNNIRELGNDISCLHQLINLYIENNKLEVLPENLKGLESLRVLHLSFNLFTELPQGLQKIPHLILLHIDHCKIKHVPNTFTIKTTSIKGLVMNDNLLNQSEINHWKSIFKSFFLLNF